MKSLNTYLVFFLLSFSHTSMAECLSDMPIQVLMDCVTIESTGEDYQQWKAAIAAAVKQEENNRNTLVDNDQHTIKKPLKPQ